MREAKSGPRASADPIEVRKLQEELRELERPLAKCNHPHQTICKLRSKAKFDRVIVELGLDNSKAARLLGVDESTVRAWRDPDQPKKAPGDWVFDALGAEALIAETRLNLARINEIKATGTGG